MIPNHEFPLPWWERVGVRGIVKDFSYFILGFYWEGPMQFPWSDLFHPGLVV